MHVRVTIAWHPGQDYEQDSEACEGTKAEPRSLSQILSRTSAFQVTPFINLQTQQDKHKDHMNVGISTGKVEMWKR